MSFLDQCANFAWQRGFPFESRYKGIARKRALVEPSGSIDIDTIKQNPAAADTTAGTRAFTSVGKTRPSVANLIRAFSTTQSDFDSETVGIFITPRGKVMTDKDTSKDTQKKKFMNLAWFTFGDNIGGSREPIPFRADLFNSPLAYQATSYYNATFMPRGFKYGLLHSLPLKASAHFRRQSYGQFRDMLEQRPYTRVL